MIVHTPAKKIIRAETSTMYTRTYNNSRHHPSFTVAVHYAFVVAVAILAGIGDLRGSVSAILLLLPCQE